MAASDRGPGPLPIENYVEAARHHLREAAAGRHAGDTLAEVAHRMQCKRHLAALTGGEDGDDDVNRAIDAQLDLLVAVYGSERLALQTALGMLGILIPTPPSLKNGHRP